MVYVAFCRCFVFSNIFFLSLLSLSVAWGQAPRRLTLSGCISLALENNLGIQRSKLNQDNARVSLLRAYFDLLPNANVSLSASSSYGRSIDPTTNLFIDTNNQRSGISGSSSLVIFDGLQRFFNISKAKVDFKARGLSLEEQRNTILLQVLRQYLSALLSKELVDNARYQQNNSEQQVLRLEKLVAAGTRARSELLEIRAQAASTKVSLVEAENNYNVSILNLKQLLLLPYQEAIILDTQEASLIDDSSFGPSYTSIEDIFAKSLVSLPNVKRAELELKSAELGVKIARGGFSPTINLGANLNTNYSSVANRARFRLGETRLDPQEIGYLSSDRNERVTVLVPQTERIQISDNYSLWDQFKDNTTTSVSISMFIPIFRRWETMSQVQRAIITRTQRRLEVQQTRNELRSLIETAYNDAKASYTLYEASRLKVAASEEAFRAIEERYNLGTSNYIDYQISSNNLFQARIEATNSKFSFLFRKKILDFYQGVSLQ